MEPVSDDDDLTPKAKQVWSLMKSEDRVPYIPQRKSSAQGAIDYQDTAPAPRLEPLASVSHSTISTTDNLSRCTSCSTNRLPVLAPLAKRRFPIDGYDKVRRAHEDIDKQVVLDVFKQPSAHAPSEIHGEVETVRRRPSGRRIFSRLFDGIKAGRNVSDASASSRLSSNSSSNRINRIPNLASTVRHSNSAAEPGIVLVHPNPLRTAPPSQEGQGHGYGIHPQNFKDYADPLEETEPSLTFPVMTLCSDITSTSVSSKPQQWIAVEITSAVTNTPLQGTLLTSSGMLANLTLDFEVQPECTIQRIVGSRSQRRLHKDSKWIVFVELIAQPVPGTDRSPLETGRRLRSHPSSQDLMDQVRQMLTPSPLQPRFHQDLLRVTLHFNHTYFPDEVKMSIQTTWTLERVSPWALNSRDAADVNRTSLCYDLYIRALHLAEFDEDVPLSERLELLECIFGQDVSRGIQQLRRQAKATMGRIRERLVMCGSVERRNAMEASAADRQVLLATMPHIDKASPYPPSSKYIEQFQPPRKRDRVRRRYENEVLGLQDVTNQYNTGLNGARKAKADLSGNLRRGREIWQDVNGRRMSSRRLQPLPLFAPNKVQKIGINPQSSCMHDPRAPVMIDCHATIGPARREHHPWRNYLGSSSQDTLLTESEPYRSSSSSRTSGDHARMSYGTFVSDNVQGDAFYRNSEIDSGYGPASSSHARSSVESHREWLGIPSNKRGGYEASYWFEKPHVVDGKKEIRHTKSWATSHRMFSTHSSEGQYADDENETQQEEDEAGRIWAQMRAAQSSSKSPLNDGKSSLVLRRKRSRVISHGTYAGGFQVQAHTEDDVFGEGLIKAPHA